jgi:hypothetical protein
MVGARKATSLLGSGRASITVIRDLFGPIPVSTVLKVTQNAASAARAEGAGGRTRVLGHLQGS